jgi:hypothetical protein
MCNELLFEQQANANGRVRKGTLVDESLGCDKAYAAASASNDCNFSVQSSFCD